MLFCHWSVAHHRWSQLIFMSITIKINPVTGNTLAVACSRSMRMRERIASLEGSKVQSNTRLCPTVVFVQRNCAVLKHMPQLSPLNSTLLHFKKWVWSAWTRHLSDETEAVAVPKIYTKVRTDSYGHIRVQINTWSFRSHMVEACSPRNKISPSENLKTHWL